jgi:RNA polymerase sigma factor (sigma-70 family)
VVALRSTAAIVDALADDVDAGFEALVRAHAGAVYSAALRLCGSRVTADDLTQDTFVRAYRALRRFDRARVLALQPRAWLLAIALNVWRNHARTAARRPRSSGHVPIDVVDGAPGPADIAEVDDAARALARLLADLPERHRVPVVLRHVAGLSYAEIAAALHCPVGTAKANVARGMRALRELADPGSRSGGPVTQDVPASRAGRTGARRDGAPVSGRAGRARRTEPSRSARRRSTSARRSFAHQEV